MRSDRELDAWEDILTNGEAALDFVRGMTFGTFAADLRTIYAVVRCLEIVSEASRRLAPEAKARHPQIPRRDVADAGNLYRHGYHRVALDIVWKTVHDELPKIIAVCRTELDAPSAP
ncbi:HepT-like ribonuclease domain-containing protein [Methylobacterium iners]|uniref:HepT-like ribonuclease domain-containing protein n=1 Tax=Methylobacterium iners TaxID=418707 RepID=UPI0024B4ED64|nr:HepT-like ribonuclease domain-containing protein [Methylobacterium iners]